MSPRRSLLLALAYAVPALSGPVVVYRTGAPYCPQERRVEGPPISGGEAVERARALLPRGFCGPSRFVSGCDFDAEWALGAWRVYALQYRIVDGRRDASGLDHSYVILDPLGNCLANIPGT